jgi:hypothetical protein
VNGDGLIRVRISQGYAMRDDDAGVVLGHGSTVAVPEATARLWLSQGWATPVVEAPQ